MKLNWVERLVVNNPLRAMEQRMLIWWLKSAHSLDQPLVALEIGCGRGAGARSILRVFSPTHLHIMDLDRRMIQTAMRHLSREEKEEISLYVGDASRLPFRESTFDAVFGFGFLHHVPDWRKALLEISRTLKVGGVYFMEELYPSLYQNFLTRHIMEHPTQDRFLSHDLRDALEDVNLVISDAIEFKKLGILGIAEKKPRSASA